MTKWKRKLNFSDRKVMIFLTILLGSHWSETENKRILQLSGLKRGPGRLRNLNTGRLWESFWNSTWLKNKMNICKVVDYGRWSLTRSGLKERVDCICNYNEISNNSLGRSLIRNRKQNSAIFQISGLKRGCQPLEKFEHWSLMRVFETVLDWKTKRLFTCTKWSLTGGGRL